MVSSVYSLSVARKSRSNFYPAFRFLPPERREALCVVYAFSRLVDDAVDQAVNVPSARKEIQLWRRRLKSCYEDRLMQDPHPLLPELTQTIENFEIPRPLFEDLLTGVEMDLTKRHYASFGELEKYCYHVAGSVGLLCNRIFGEKGEAHREYALHLGTAFQLTNILRDVGSDLDRGRIYIPLEDFRRFSYRPEQLQKKVINEAYYRLMNFEAARAWGYFEAAERCLPEPERRRLLPAEVMSRFYRAILRRLEDERFPSLQKKVALPRWKKMSILGTSWMQSKISLL